jgi:NAD(P)-dependent dehydrogenase (short-subunit alcohol dehydrogenase family)
VKTDVAEWDQLVALFKTALEKHGRVDVVFANAGESSFLYCIHTPTVSTAELTHPTIGIGVSDMYLSLPTSPNGDPLPPTHRTININLLSCMNTALLGIHYMKAQSHGGSIICTASVSSYVRFAGSDYATAKHGVLGFMRSLYSQVGPNAPVEGESNVKAIRVNAVAPSWTSTGLVPTAVIESVGVKVQGPDVVARSVALLAVDEKRHGECIYSADGEFKEVDKMILTKTDEVLGENTESGAGGVMERLREMRKRAAAGGS